MGVAKPLWKDGTMMTNTVSLCQILGGLTNRSFHMTQWHWKIIPTWLLGKKEVGTKNPGKLLRRKNKCKRLHDEHTEITGECNKPILPAQQVRQRLHQQFEGLEEYDYRLEQRTRTAILPLLQDDAFIFVNVLAAEQ